MDQSTYVPIETTSGNVSYTLTADTTKSVTIRAPGWSYLRVSVQGTGTVTSSSATVTARYMTRSTNSGG